MTVRTRRASFLTVAILSATAAPAYASGDAIIGGLFAAFLISLVPALPVYLMAQRRCRWPGALVLLYLGAVHAVWIAFLTVPWVSDLASVILDAVPIPGNGFMSGFLSGAMLACGVIVSALVLVLLVGLATRRR